MSAPASTSVGRFRADIQGLRAVAVLMVLVYHVWPSALPGGYAGVDVFFVISGFLITSLLLRELDRSETISLRSFYLRRARRLLPASLATLAAIAALTWLVAPQLYWRSAGRHITASLLYAENWLLRAEAVDYLALDAAPGPTQHFWSLSLEEQFYFGWPLLLLLAFGAARAARARPRRPIAGCLAAVVALSLGWSIYTAETAGGLGYFSTFTRVWELAVGALLAALGHGERDRNAPGLALIGLAAIGASGLVLDDQTHFPGYAALLPVLATALVLATGGGCERSPWTRWLAWRPIQFVGDVSYSLYLVHWPVVVFWHLRAGAAGKTPSLLEGLALIAASIALAAISRRWIEERFRQTRGRRRDGLFVATAALATGLCATAALAMSYGASIQHNLIASAPGAAVIVRPGPLAPPGRDFIPALANVRGDMAEAYKTRCFSELGESEVATCVYGPDDADLRIAVIGDSHAIHWFPAFRRFADFIDVQIVGIAKPNCALSDTVLYQRKLKRRLPDCRDWSRAVVRHLAIEHVDLAVISFAPRSYVDGIETGKLAPHIETIAAGTGPLLTEIASFGTRVVVLGSTPWHPTQVPECVAQTAPPYDGCTKRPASSVRDGAAEIAARRLGLRVVEVTDLFCRDDQCPPVIGGVFVYRDSHHITATYARSLGPILMYRLLGER